MAPERRCGTCRWFVFEEVLGELMFSQCHRFPPPHDERCWPSPTPEDWCGEWAAREEGPDA